MTTKATKAMPKRAAMPAVEVDERHQGDVDTFVERNRDELNASIGRSREEVRRGIKSTRTIGHIIEDGRKRYSAG